MSHSNSTIVLNDKKTIRAWSLFDWANSAYALVISTAVFPAYYEAVTPEEVEVLGYSMYSSALFSFAVSFSFVLVALFSPFLSGMADYGGKRMLFLKIFTTIGGISCAAMFFFKDASWMWFGTWAFVLATLGYAGGIVFYNSYIPIIATKDQYDKVSAQGFAYGYFGSVLLLLFVLFMIQKPEVFGITDTSLPPRIGFLLVGVWWIAFAQLTFRYLPKDREGPIPPNILKRGYDELKEVAKRVRNNKNVSRFLISFFFFSAGVQTVIYLASIFAKKEVGFTTSDIILVVLILQLLAIVGAYLFAFISRKYGNKVSISIMLVIWAFICFVACFTYGKINFYILSAFVGMVMGGIQSQARSGYAKMLEKDEKDITSYFSFYDVVYKVSVVAGTFIFGFIEIITNSMRYSFLTLSILFIIGFIVLMGVDFGDRNRVGEIEK